MGFEKFLDNYKELDAITKYELYTIHICHILYICALIDKAMVEIIVFFPTYYGDPPYLNDG